MLNAFNIIKQKTQFFSYSESTPSQTLVTQMGTYVYEKINISPVYIRRFDYSLTRQNEDKSLQTDCNCEDHRAHPTFPADEDFGSSHTGIRKSSTHS